MTEPIINSVSPLFGPNNVETSIQIFGSGFDPGPLVYVGDTLCTDIVRPNTSQINCTVPAGIIPSSYPIKVVNTGLEEFTLDDAFRVIYPMPTPRFTTETKEAILSRMLEGLEDEWEVSQGSPIYAVLATAALELARAYRRADDIIRLFFPQYSRSGYLDLFGEGIGLLRESAINAVGEVQFTGSNGTIIPAGTLVSTQVVYGQNAAPVVFETTAQGTISGTTAIVPVRALVPGANGNLSPNQIVRISSSVAGLTSVTNLTNTVGGVDIESDDAYRVRILNFVQNPPAGGNAQDYVRWALEVPGVGFASVVPLGRGPGTVDVYILDDSFEPPDGTLLDSVQDYIAPSPADEGGGKAPIGADVQILAPTVVPIDVTVDIQVSDGFDPSDVQSEVEASIDAYIRGLGMGQDVIYVQVAHAMVHHISAVYDYADLEVNSGTANISINTDEKAMPGTITVGLV